MSTIKNMNLLVANFAMECVNRVLSVNENNCNNDSKKESQDNDKKKVDKDKYSTLVKKMATMIQKNGYIATLAFCLSKGNPEHNEVLSNIIAWNYKNEKIKEIVFDSDFINTIDENGQLALENNSEEEKCKIFSKNYDVYILKITNLSQGEYRLITKEMMNLFGWIKRFADGMIKDEKKDESSNNN